MARSKAQRDADRQDILRVLEEQGPMMTGDLLAAAYDVTEVMTGSRIHTQGMTDLHALERDRLVMPVPIEQYFAGWALADQAVLDEREDALDVAQLQAGWQPADQAPPTAVERVQAMQAAGEVRLCRQTKPLTEATAQAIADFADFLEAQPPRSTTPKETP